MDGGERRLMTFPSGGALLYSWKLDLSLGMSFFDFRRGGDVSIRRPEDAKRNRYSCVEVQIAGLRARELFSNSFRVSKGRQEGASCFTWEEGEEGRKRL